MLSIARNGAKICKENPLVFYKEKIRGKIFHEIYQSLQCHSKLKSGIKKFSIKYGGEMISKLS
jgi:hypothetical protein